MPRFTIAGAGDMIYEQLESTGTSTSPANTQHFFAPEQGFMTMSILLQSTVASEGDRGAAKVVADNTEAGAGYLGITGTRYVAATPTGGRDAFCGILSKNLLESTAVNDREQAEVQCYGYFQDAVVNTDTTINQRLAPETATDGLVDVSTYASNAAVTLVRCGAIALEADTAGAADVFLCAM